jgi:ABC-type glycerol-3-phosphate transport system substrate-binding protein
MCNQVPETYKDFFVLAKRKLSSLSRDVSFLYDDDDINISLELQNERYYSLNTYNVDDFSYSITDKAKDEKIIFSIKGDKIVNIYISKLDVIPDDDPNYEEVIKVAHSFSNSQQEALNLLVSNFNKKYQNKYRVELSRGFNVVDDISIAASAGEKETLPQLALANTLDLEKIVSDDSLRKYLYNLDSVINDENIGLSESERNMFNKTMFDDTNNYSVEGRWSLPYSSSNLYLCYDSTLFEGDNPQFDHLPKTFEDMMEMCSILKQSKGNNYIPLYVNYDSSFIMDLMLQKDIPMFSSNAQTTEFIKDEYRNQIINLMSELKAYYDSGLFTSKGITGGQYASGSDHAFVIAVASSVNYLAPSYKLAPIPYVNGHQAYFHSGDLTGLTLLKTGKPYATRGAWLFAKELMSSSSINEPLSRLSVPAIDSTYEPTGNELTDNMMLVYQNVKDKYVCFPKVKGANEICNILNSFLARTIQTGSSIDSAVSRLIEEIRNAIL